MSVPTVTPSRPSPARGPGGPAPLSRGAVVVILAAVALVAAISGYAFGQGSGSGSGGATAAPVSDVPHPSLGSPDAPVTMVEYSDFRCPFCGRFAREVEPALVQRYVQDGLLRIEWHDYPAQGSESTALAIAGRAADAQGAFWTFHNAVYANQQRTYDEKAIRELAGSIGLDLAQFDRDRATGGYALAARSDFDEGRQRGVRGTPSFFINGRAIVGAQPVSVFVSAIEQALDDAGVKR